MGRTSTTKPLEECEWWQDMRDSHKEAMSLLGGMSGRQLVMDRACRMYERDMNKEERYQANQRQALHAYWNVLRGKEDDAAIYKLFHDFWTELV